MPRDPDEDFDTLDDAGNDSPEGLWSNGTTMWVADYSDDKIYAYSMATKARDSDKDFETPDDAGNEHPKGIWSDGTTMWVADYSDDKIYAYDMDSKGRVSSKDFNTLEDAENEGPEGIWSDGATMWVVDYSDEKIYAYNLNTKGRVSSKDFDTLEEADNESPAGLWSDRTTVWVADSSDSKIYAYNAPDMAPAPVISNRAPAVSKVTPTSASVSLYVGNSQTFEASASDPDDNLTSWDWSIDGTSENNGRFGFWPFYNSPSGTVTKEFTHTFSSAGTYTVKATFTDEGARSGSVTWTVEVINRAPVISSASPSSSHVLLTMGGSQTFSATVSDADNNLKSWDWSVDGTSEDSGNWGTLFSPTPTGPVTKSFSHTFSAVGGYKVRATFTDTDGDSDSQEWMVQVVQETGDYERDSDKDFNTLDAAGNGSPAGIWSDGTTMWVADSSNEKIYAYNLSTKARDSAKDFITLEDAGNDSPEGIWSDETTMWVADSTDEKIYAYNLSTKARDSAKDFDTLEAAGNGGPAGIWSDGTTMWVADYSDEKIYAYNLSTKARDSAKDFNTLEDAGNDSPAGIWSDETTMWVADYSDDKIYAYSLSAKAGDFGKDFNALDAAGNEGPAGIWSDGTTMWVADYSDDKIYAYDGPGMAAPIPPEPTNSPPSVSKVTPTSVPVSLYVGNSQTFEASASDPDDNLTSWDWSIDGTSKDSGRFGFLLIYNSPTGTVTKEFTHTFSSAGTYTVKAAFTDEGGSSGYVTWTVDVVNRSPVISSATPSPSSTVTLTTGDSQTFEATVSDPDNNLKSWDWSVDGTSEDSGTWGTQFSSTPAGSVTKSFSPTFSSVGTSAVKATFTDAESESASEEWTVEVSPTSGTTPRAEITSCGSDPASPSVRDGWTPVAEVINHSFSGLLRTKFYVQFTIKDPARGLAHREVESTKEAVSVGSSHTFRGELVESWPDDDKEQRVEDGSHQLSLFPLNWFPGQIDVKCELKAEDHLFGDDLVDEDTGKVAVPDFQHSDADAKTTTCGPSRQPVLSGEEPTLQANTMYLGSKKGLTRFAVEYWVHHKGLRVHHSGDDVNPGSRLGDGGNSSSGWTMEEWERPENWINLGSQKLPTGTYTLDCALWGHFVSPAYKRLMPVSRCYEVLVAAVQLFSNPIQGIIELVVGPMSPLADIQKLEREISKWTDTSDYSLQGLVSTEFSVVEARWGTAGLGIERGTEMLLEGRERIRVRVIREEKENRAEERVAAPDFHIEGPELGQTKKKATRCEEGDQDHDKYLSLCWETTFDIPVNDTINPRKYSVWVGSDLIEDVQTNSFTVIASPDTAGLRAFYDDTGGPNWVNKSGWLSSDPIGDWYGVDTNAGGRVEKLDLRGSGQRGNGLQGPLPSDLKDTLPFLHTLYLGGNGGLTECVREDLLDVRTNDLATSLDLPTCEDTCAWGGALPDPNNQGLVADCEALLAARDTLTAGQPSGRLNWSAREPIGNWRGVVRDGNPERVIRFEIKQPPWLWGYISGEIAKLSSLQVLTLANVGLRGEIPEELKDLASLNTLNLQGNQLTGGIPRELSGLTSLHTLDLSENDLNRRIPGNLTELVNLQTLRLDGNRFSGCIPEGLRGVANNDLGDLGLPFCDVLLSGLTISPGVLTPRFESGRTEYTAEVGVSRTTVTPTNSHNATFMFLDENVAPIPDADGTLAGHQVELGNGVTTIGVKVLSLDAGASHTYTIQVSRGGSLPDAPAIVVPITPGAAFLTVSWTAPPGETGITSYDLRYIESGSLPDANWTVEESVWMSGSGSPNYQITGLANGTPYDVQVRTVNAAGHGFWSAIATGTPRTTPGSPVIDSLGPGDSTLAVEWSAPATDGGAEVAGYDLRFIPSDAPDKADANWTGRNNIWSSGTLRHDLGGLTNGIGYDVQVRGVNPAGHGLWSTTAAGTPLTTPGAPAIDSLGPGDGALTVEWSAPATDGGAEVAGYDLRFIPSDAPDKADANWTGRNNIWSSDALRYDLGGLTNGVSHDVLVRAVNAVGHGPWSPAATGTPRTTPGAPVIDSLIPGDGALTVEWSDPATDGGADVTGYDLRYIRSDAPDRADANWTVRSSIWSSGTLRYDLGGLTDGVGYDVQVRAANAAGHGQWSGSITVTLHTMPTAPAIVSVDAGDGALIISWTEPADTGGLNIQGYDVRYIPAEENNPGATWTEEQDVWTLGSLEHTITGLTNGVRYDLELRAVTSAGDGPWSATFSGTPKTTPDVPIISLIIPDGSTLTVAWDAPANTGGSAITSYDLRYIESGAIDKADANWTEEVPAWSTGPLSYAFGSLTGGTPYDVQVRAVNTAGAGPWSATFAGTPVTMRASRSFSPAPVSAGGELEVTITAAGYGGFGGVVETLPIGFSYVSSSLSDSAVTVAGREVSFTLFGDTAFAYTVAAPSAGGTYSFSGVLKNSNAVEQPVGGVSSITVEAGALSVSITRNATTLVRLGTAIPVTATFGAPVSGFSVEDVSAANGDVSNFAGSRADYAFEVTPNGIGEVTVDIAAGAATDAGGNGNTAASQLSLGIPYDDDGNGAIDKAEVITAINDYLFGEGDEAISKTDVITLINLYLFD